MGSIRIGQIGIDPRRPEPRVRPRRVVEGIGVGRRVGGVVEGVGGVGLGVVWVVLCIIEVGVRWVALECIWCWVVLMLWEFSQSAAKIHVKTFK